MNLRFTLYISMMGCWVGVRHRPSPGYVTRLRHPAPPRGRCSRWQTEKGVSLTFSETIHSLLTTMKGLHYTVLWYTKDMHCILIKYTSRKRSKLIYNSYRVLYY